jgi:hypothetical protein
MLNWQMLAIGAVLIAGASFSSGWYFQGLRKDAAWATRMEAEKQAVREAYIQQCEEQKLNAKKLNDDLQSRLSAVSAKRDSLSRYAATCVPVSRQPTQLPASGVEHAGQNGLLVGWLRDFAAECEAYRVQRIIAGQYFDSLTKH